MVSRSLPSQPEKRLAQSRAESHNAESLQGWHPSLVVLACLVIARHLRSELDSEALEARRKRDRAYAKRSYEKTKQSERKPPPELEGEAAYARTKTGKIRVIACLFVLGSRHTLLQLPEISCF